MHINGLKRYLRRAVFVFHEVHGHHDHARNPKEDNVKTGDQHAGWVKGFKHAWIGVRVCPIKRTKRPQTRAKPGIKHVIILAQFNVVA